MTNILKSLRINLINISDEKTRQSGLRYFKEPVDLYGIKSAQVSALAKTYFQQIKHFGKNDIFGLCEQLWKSQMLEETFIACNWSYSLRKQYTTDDFLIFERWVKQYVNNWASCDTLCNHTIGELIERFPELLPQLQYWTQSENVWVRRASAVTLIVPARKGKFITEIFQIADSLLTDREDMVQKGYGWMLKAASQAHQKQVFEYVMKNKTIMPRTALRYAIEKMPEHLRLEAMAK